jgi:hypothetical protein
MPNCDGLLAGNILNDCDNSVIGGIEVDVMLFNLSDINKVATTYNTTNKLLVDNFELKAGKTGFLLDGVKQVNALKWELVKKELGNDKYKHTFTFVILNPSVANRKLLADMNGGYFAVMVETKWKGASSAEPFLIGGYDSGMQLQTATFSTNENDGTISVEMSSVEGYEEPKPVLTFLDTDYATSKTLFDAKFIEA